MLDNHNQRVLISQLDIARFLRVVKDSVAQYLKRAQRAAEGRENATNARGLIPLPEFMAGVRVKAQMWDYYAIRSWASTRPYKPLNLPNTWEELQQSINTAANRETNNETAN